MKRITVLLATGALATMFLAPCAMAQSPQDMQSDQAAIDNGRDQIHHDRQELRNDLRNGDYGAAAHEQAEMNRRHEALRERQDDLNNDMANQAYRDDDDNYGANGAYGDDDNGYANNYHHGRHHHHDQDDND